MDLLQNGCFFWVLLRHDRWGPYILLGEQVRFAESLKTMAGQGKRGIFSRLLDRMSQYAIDLLTKPIKSYALHIPNDIEAINRHIRNGELYLIPGKESIRE